MHPLIRSFAPTHRRPRRSFVAPWRIALPLLVLVAQAQAQTAPAPGEAAPAAAQVLSGSLGRSLSGTDGETDSTETTSTDTGSTETQSAAPDSTAAGGPMTTTFHLQAAATSGAAVISEFRLDGPEGSGDEFIEIFNASNGPLDLSGWSVVAGGVTIPIPAGQVLPIKGHLLLTGSSYSLGDMGGAGNMGGTGGDVNYSHDLAPDTLLELHDATGALTDAVSCAALPSPGSGAQYSYARRLNLTTGLAQDSNDDLSDFNLLDVAATAFGADSLDDLSNGKLRLGAPGPENRHSAINRSVVYTNFSAIASENSVRDSTPGAGGAPLGTLSLRRSVTNNTGAPLTSLRFRVINATAGTSSAPAPNTIADVRYVHNPNTGLMVNGIPLVPMTLEEVPGQSYGGGLNCTLKIPLPAGGLPNGATVHFEMLLGVFKSGSYRTAFLFETTSPEPAKPDVAVRLLESEEDATAEVADSDWTGSGVTSGDGSGQTLSSVTMIGHTRRYGLRVTNRGEQAAPFKISLPAPPAGWSVHLFDALTGGNDITSAAHTAAGWTTPSLAAGQSVPLRLEVTPSATATGSYDALLGAQNGALVDAVKVASTLQKIAKLQWSRDGETWSDVTSAPLSVDRYEVIAFRAVGTNPSISWDDLPGFMPVWSSQGETHWGEVVWQHFPTAGTVSAGAECGNQMTATVQVAEAP